MYLHHPQILRAVELARSGALGRLELVNGSFSFFLTHPDDPRVDPTKGGGSLWDVGCYPVSLRPPDRRRGCPTAWPPSPGSTSASVDRTFIGQLRFPGGLLAQFDCGFAAPDRERLEVVGSDATLVLGSPFLPEPEGPPPTLTLWRGRDATPIAVASVDQYAAEVDDLTRGDPRRHDAPDGPRLQSGYHRHARRPRRCRADRTPGCRVADRRPGSPEPSAVVATTCRRRDDLGAPNELVAAVVGLVGRRGRGDRLVRRPAVEPATHVPAGRQPSRVVGGAALGRGDPRRDPARSARPDGPRPEPVPHLRRDVGCLGGLRPDGGRLHLQGEAHRVERGRGPPGGDELRRLPDPHVALHQGGRRRRFAVRVRRRDGFAVLPDRGHDDRRRFARGRRQPDRGRGHRLRAWPTARTRRTATRTRPTRRSTMPLVVAKSGDDDEGSQPLAAAPDRAHGLPERDPRRSTASSRPSGRSGATSQSFALPDARCRRRADGPGAPADARRRSGLDRPGVQGSGDRGDPGQQRARSGTSRRRSTSRPAARGNNTPRHERRQGLRGQPGDGPAVRAERRQPRRLRPGAGRVLGRRPQVGDAARPLERDRQHGVGRAGAEPARSAAPGRASTGSSGTSSCTSRSTARSTMRPSPPGG